MKKTSEKYIRNLKIVSGILIVLIFVLTLVVLDLINKNYVKDNTKGVYAEVVSVYDDFLLAKDLEDDSKYTIKTKDLYNEGDIIYVTYLRDIENPKKIDLVLNNSLKDESEMIITETTTTKEVEQTATIEKPTEIITKRVETTSEVVTNTIKETTSKAVTASESVDSIVLNYVESVSTKIDNFSVNDSNKKTAKEYFCSIVDFIFYDGEIKGHTFNELSSSAKAKVVYYALIIDNKIDSKWPNYKETLSNAYYDIKVKLVAKYIQIVEYVKVNEPELYNNLKYDFDLLKKSINLTWDIVSSAFKYVGGNAVELIKEWYQNFRG